MRGMCLILLSAACAPDLGAVELQGVLVDDWTGSPRGVEGATMVVFDEDKVEFDRVTSGPGGFFRAAAPAAERTFVQIAGDGLLPTGFSGLAGLNPRLRIPNGTFIAISDSRWAEELARWDGCPELGEQGTVLGRAELANFTTEDGKAIILETAKVTVQVSGGPLRSACYLGDDGTFDPESTQSGPTGEFLVSNVAAGEHLMSLNWVPVDGFSDTQNYATWVPEGGVAPRFPLLVEAPLDTD